MQIFNAPPRDGLSVAQVTSLLTAPALSVSAGCDLLNADLSFAEDISDDLAGGSIARNLFSRIHGTCDLQLSRELVWGNALVQPWMFMVGSGVSARFDLGVYALTTPGLRVGETPVTYDVQGYDRLYLLSREVGADYTVSQFLADGTTPRTYRQALLDAFAAAGLTGALIEGSAADNTLPKSRVWPLVADNQADPDQTSTPVTWLRIINDLLRAINFRGVWADERGVFRCQAYQEPAVRASEFDLSADDVDLTIVGVNRGVLGDVWDTPNRWVAIASNPPEGVTPSVTNGLVQIRENLTDGPTSQAQRTPAVWGKTFSYEAATAAVLSGLIDRRVGYDRRLTRKVEMSTGPLPIAGHADIVKLTDTAAGVSGKAQARSWSLPLDGSDMSWVFELIL